MPYVTVDGAKVHYAHRPGGPNPIIFLHGGFGSTSELWEDTMAALPPEWTGYAIDNFIRSDAPPDGYSVTAFARRVKGFCEALGLKRPVVGGHSMGGVVTQLVGATYPDLPGGLVLVCTGASMANHDLARQWLKQLADHGAEPGTIRDISANWFRSAPEAFFEKYVALAETAPLQPMVDVQASLIDTDMRPRLGTIKAPTLVVFGAHDAGRTIDFAQTLTNGIPNARMVTMADSGHTPMAETPEVFDTALHAFLKPIATTAA
ncbi:alpha/beta hydrolase [Azorhizobium oxalatiphilum]|uniref:Alpha/beta hydrolase n=1 Tax=Azorhizobium oxalatiphilum TaxID=980631 RepID=A0A917F3Q3_9HYPH|nr:alpha/beta hydrolase [Azorhizobium oxalatiphilum]GGF50342.1 alpha/beta hydrolase [Azorhizobium oxalatiphilum]